MGYRFFIPHQSVEQWGLECLKADANAARLSRKFQVYYRLRPFIPLFVRQMLQRHRQVEVSDNWYLPEDSLHGLSERVEEAGGTLRMTHPWPSGARFAIVLTHDVETKEGLANLQPLAKIEEELGFRSSWNLIPYKYRIDPGLVADLKARGHEIGIHGYNHDGRLYCSQAIFEKRAALINEALRKYDAVGFRSPMVHRNLDWLSMLDIQYDASCFDIDPFQAMPGGTGSLWPFVVNGFVELPYTLPQDHTLFIAQGQQDASLWKHKLDYVARRSGMALMLTHPDYMLSERTLSLYREVLQRVHEQGDYWHALPRDVAAWWRQRDGADPIQNAPDSANPNWQAVKAVLRVSDEDLSIEPE